MATIPTTPHRHALGMPAGSVRALLCLGILVYSWVLILLLTQNPSGDEIQKQLQEQSSLSFIYMQFLLVLMFAHFFSAHGYTIGGQVSNRSPLGLPKGTLRILLLAGYLLLVVWSYRHSNVFSLPDKAPVLRMLMILIGAYSIGYLTNSLVKVFNHGFTPPWLQDVQAWFSLVGLGIRVRTPLGPLRIDYGIG
ncbi:MAG: hypothetical protein SNJ75_16655, partial [Gemmataceae bacterium]